MNIKEFEQKYNVLLIPKSKSFTMKLFGFFCPCSKDYWTTYRLPFQKKVKITYPSGIKKPMRYIAVLEHELMHAGKDFATAWQLFKTFFLLWLLPLPVFFSGRWLIEKNPYVHSIIFHGYGIEQVVNILWRGYGWIWPKCCMRKYFKKKIKDYKDGKYVRSIRIDTE